MPTLYGVVWKKSDNDYKMENPAGLTLEDAKAILTVAKLNYPNFEFHIVEMKAVGV